MGSKGFSPLILFRKIFGNRGQSTVELALTLPLLFFLLGAIIFAFRKNDGASDRIIVHQKEFYDVFNHGNPLSADIELAPFQYRPGTIDGFVPPNAIFSSLDDFVENTARNLANSFVKDFFDQLSVFEDSTYLNDFIEGYSRSAASSLILTGSIDWEQARMAGFAGTFSSLQARDHFQGKDHAAQLGGFNRREFFGSGLQSSALAFVNSGGNALAALGGGLGGMLQSDTSGRFFENDQRELFKGAARGALNTTISGLTGKGDISLGEVAKGAALGSFQTRTVARALTPSSLEGSDPKSSITFGAASAIAGALAKSEAKLGFADLLSSGLGGAFLSTQGQAFAMGQGGNISQFIRKTSASAAFSASQTAISGGSGTDVGLSALSSLAGSGLSLASTAVSNTIENVVEGPLEAVQKRLNLSDTVDSITDEVTTGLEDLQDPFFHETMVDFEERRGIP